MDLDAEVGEDFDLEGLEVPEGYDEETVEVEEGSPDEPEVAEPSHLDVDTYGSHLVPVTIDGETHMVPLSEVQGGYQRQADSTRKWQEAASLRQEAQAALALMAAFKQDPTGTLEVLAQEAGVDFSRPNAQGEEMTPLERQVNELLVREQRREIDAEVARLTSTYGDKFDVTEALAYATTNRTSLTLAAKALAADKFLAEQVKGAVQAQRQADDDARTAAKRGAQVAGGHTAKVGKGTLNPNDLSTEDLYDAVEKGLIK
jgi:hypothetical protein